MSAAAVANPMPPSTTPVGTRNDQVSRARSDTAVDASAFEALLAAVNFATPAGLQARLDTQAEQVFDAPAGRQGQSAATTGNAGADAASAAAGDQPAGTAPDAANKTAGAGRFSAFLGERGPTTASADKPAGSSPGTGSASSTATDADRPSPAGDAQRAEAALTRGRPGADPTTGTRPATSPSSAAASAATGRAAASVVPTVDASSRSAGSVARQVGQVLGTAAGKGVELAGKAPTGAESPAGAQDRAAAGKGQSSSGQRTGSSANSANAQSAKETQSPVFERLLRSLRVQGGPYRSTAQLRLDPPELGRMRVQVEMTGSTLRLAVQTERPEAQALVTDRLGSLRSALAQHGLTIERVEVTTAPAETWQNEAADGQWFGADGNGGFADSQAGEQQTAGTNESAPIGSAAETDEYDETARAAEAGPLGSIRWAGAEAQLDIRA